MCNCETPRETIPQVPPQQQRFLNIEFSSELICMRNILCMQYADLRVFLELVHSPRISLKIQFRFNMDVSWRRIDNWKDCITRGVGTVCLNLRPCCIYIITRCFYLLLSITYFYVQRKFHKRGLSHVILKYVIICKDKVLIIPTALVRVVENS